MNQHNPTSSLALILAAAFSINLVAVPVGDVMAQAAPAPSSSGLSSIDTGYTISKVRTAFGGGGPYIVASSYEGTVMGVSYQGASLWKNSLSGYMNHDLWCADISGDGVDEVLAANADGSIYCLSSEGELRWRFKVNDAPMYAVCVVHDSHNTPFVNSRQRTAPLSR